MGGVGDHWHRPGGGVGIQSPQRRVRPQGRYTCHGIAFDYPSAWKRLPLGGTARAGAPPIWADKIGDDELSQINVSANRMGRVVTEGNFGAIQPEAENVLDQLRLQSGGEFAEVPTVTQVAGRPAIGATIRSPQLGWLQIVFIFDGDIQYAVACQYPVSAEAAVGPMCQRVFDSFEVTG